MNRRQAGKSDAVLSTHLYAGNLADVQKHAILAWILAYLQRKDKPISYIETHSGRAVYDLTAAEAMKTGEAALGIQRPDIAAWFDADHPYAIAMHQVASQQSANHYPGSPKSPKSCYATKIRSI